MCLVAEECVEGGGGEGNFVIFFQNVYKLG